MAFHIKHNHPVLSLSDRFSEIGKDFIEHHNLNHIWFVRLYKDGSFNMLRNYAGFFLDWMKFEWPVYISFQEEHEKLQSYLNLWDEGLSLPIVPLAREKHNRKVLEVCSNASSSAFSGIPSLSLRQL